jgi:hypothetical protein
LILANLKDLARGQSISRRPQIVYLKKEPDAMKPIRCRALLLFFISSWLVPGCRGGQDRQMVYTMPRVAAVQVDRSKDAQVKAPFGQVKAPVGRQIPASAGVDVPMIEPE